MTTKVDFFHITKEVKTCIQRMHKQTEEDVKRKMVELRAWFDQQTQFELDMPDAYLEHFLCRENFNVARTKEIVTNYQSLPKICPDFYYCRDPRSPDLVNAFNTMCYMPLPTLTEDLQRIFISKLLDFDPDKWITTNYFTQVLNVQELCYFEDYSSGDIILIDCSGLSMRHAVKVCNLSLLLQLKKLVKMFAGTYAITAHFFNLGNITEQIIKAAHFVSTNTHHKIVVHSNMESLWKAVDRKLLPKDYGGEAPSIAELRELQWQKFEEYNFRFKHFDESKIVQAVRAAKLQAENDEYGTHGTFRKLQVD